MSESYANSTRPGDGLYGASGQPYAASTRPEPPGIAVKCAGALLLILSALAALSLATWSAADPSLTHLSTAKPTNALGAIGAIVSDLALSALGLASVLALLPPLYWSLQLIGGARVNRVQMRALAAPFAVLAFAAFFSSLPKVFTWPLASAYGGLLGDLLHAFLASTVAMVVNERAGLLASLLSLAAAGTLMTVALGLSRDDLKAMARFAARPFEPDSSWVSRLKNTTHTVHAAHAAPIGPLTAAAQPNLATAGFTPPPLSLTPEHETTWTTHHGHHGRGFADAPTYVGATPPLVSVTTTATLPTLDLMRTYGEPEARSVDPSTRAAVVAVAHYDAPPHQETAAPTAPVAAEAPRLSYPLPPTSLLAPSSTQRASALEMSIAEKLRGDRLRDVLAQFAVPGTVTTHWTGPVVTTFVFEPQAGTKTARILGLADDIAKSLGVAAVRLQLAAGRGALVIEVPHDDAIAIGLRDLVEHESFTTPALRLPLALGASSQGEPVVVDLAALPSLLLAGRHADERGGALRALVTSLAYRHTPTTLSLAVADADGSLSALAALPHCSGHAPLVAAQDAVDLLSWAASEIDARTLRLRAAAQSRTIETYNARITTDDAVDMALMPYLVLVVADIAPLAALDAPAFDYALHRIVREGAAVGVHIIAGTSRTDDHHFPEAVRAAFPTRLALQLANRSDSRAVLDDTGAEELLGQGDTLAVTPSDDVRRTFGGGTLARLHLTRVSFEEAHAITAACQPVAASPTATTAAIHTPVKSAVPAWKPANATIDDALYGRAISLVRRVSAIDAGMFRRGLAVSYAEALALMDRLAADRLIGPENADGTHTVLIGRAA